MTSDEEQENSEVDENSDEHPQVFPHGHLFVPRYSPTNTFEFVSVWNFATRAIVSTAKRNSWSRFPQVLTATVFRFGFHLEYQFFSTTQIFRVK